MTQERVAEVERVCAGIATWAVTRADVVVVALVGSWARARATAASDVDVVVLTTDPAGYVETTEWIHGLGDGEGLTLLATRPWGAVTERRSRRPSGLEVEIGFAEPSWATIDPVDPGTADVVSAGCRALYDPDHLVTTLLVSAGVRADRARPPGALSAGAPARA